ncbi:MAG: hypothetical protein ACE5MG_11265 [Candidatus Methylomirabilales bacterium]
MPIGPLARGYFEGQERDISGSVRDVKDVGAVYRCLKSLEDRGMVERVRVSGLSTLWRARPEAEKDRSLQHYRSLFRRRLREGWSPSRIAQQYGWDPGDVFRVLTDPHLVNK